MNTAQIITTILILAQALTFAAGRKIKNFKTNHVYRTAVQDDTLWAATRAGLAKWNLKSSSYSIIKVRTSRGPVELTCISIDSEGNKWLGTKGAGAVMYSGTHWEYYNKDRGIENQYINDIVQDKAGNIWVEYLNNFVIKFNNQ